MKIRLGDLRKIIREALGEQGAQDNLAAWVDDGELKKTAVIYSPSALIDFSKTIDGVAQPKSLAGELVDNDIVKGYIAIRQPDESTPCNGAWEVIFSVGPRLGEVVYGVGFALSPSGILMPDRRSVSQKARRRWEKEGGRRVMKPLDNFEHPPVNPERNNLHDRHHTPDDASDDCRINPQGFDILNHSYQSDGGEKSMLADMRRLHLKTMEWFNDNSGHPASVIERLLTSAGFAMLDRFL
jgi:hypothetical protein